MCKHYWQPFSVSRKAHSGFSLVEALVVVAISLVVIGMAAKAMFSAVNTYRVDTAGNQLASLVHVAKMKAAAHNTRYRVVNYANAYGMERYNRTTDVWETDPGSAAFNLPRGVAFSTSSPTAISTPAPGMDSVAEATSLTYNTRALLVDDSGVMLDGGCFYLQGSTLRPIAVCSNLPGKVTQYRWNGSAWEVK